MIDTDKYEGHSEMIDANEIGEIWEYLADTISEDSRGRAEANYNLVADAPDLLAEVKWLRKELAHYTDNCTIVWMPEDVLYLDDTLTDEQASWILERMERKHDASLGITWDTIQFWIDEVKE